MQHRDCSTKVQAKNCDDMEEGPQIMLITMMFYDYLMRGDFGMLSVRGNATGAARPGLLHHKIVLR